MDVYLIDGTYELFRHFHALPRMRDGGGVEVAAVRGVLRSLLGMMRAGETYLGVATDHVVESYRNRMWAGYKTGEGVEPELLAQFGLLEEALRLLGVTVWAMVEEEADDALASAARLAARDSRVERVYVCTPDKDLAQCVEGGRVVQMDRRKNEVRDEAGVWGKFGVGPGSIPDYLALVGDTADGYPGLRGWGAKSAAAVLARWGTLEAIPEDVQRWGVVVTAPRGLNEVLRADWERALLFRELARLKRELPLFADVEELRWLGPTDGFAAMGERLDGAKVVKGTGKAIKGRRRS